MYLALDPGKIINSSQKLLSRIEQSFPTAGLKKVSIELLEIAKKSVETASRIRKPLILLRILVGLIILSFLFVVIRSAISINFDPTKIGTVEFVQAFEALMNVAIFAGVALVSLMTLETRIKRHRALKAVHELRALAHVIDMHQLTKDPEIILVDPKITPSNPTDSMTPGELSRYLDFCCDMLSLIAKMAALYVQNFDDPVVLSAVNDVESLTTGLSTKIWQKIQTVNSIWMKNS